MIMRAMTETRSERGEEDRDGWMVCTRNAGTSCQVAVAGREALYGEVVREQRDRRWGVSDSSGQCPTVTRVFRGEGEPKSGV